MVACSRRLHPLLRRDGRVGQGRREEAASPEIVNGEGHVKIIRHEITTRSPVLMGANRKPLVANSVGRNAFGKLVRAGIGLRPSAMELGSIAASVVCEDAQLERAAPRIANAGFRRAGQACTSTQRLFVHEDVLERFTGLLIAATEKLPVGDPHDPRTVVGPMIHEREAIRAEEWVREAVTAGARLLHRKRNQRGIVTPKCFCPCREWEDESAPRC
jgi:hypothetical protein